MYSSTFNHKHSHLEVKVSYSLVKMCTLFFLWTLFCFPKMGSTYAGINFGWLKYSLTIASGKYCWFFFSLHVTLLYHHPLPIFKKRTVIHISSTSGPDREFLIYPSCYLIPSNCGFEHLVCIYQGKNEKQMNRCVSGVFV